MVMYQVIFKTVNGEYQMWTTDALKIGPWIAEMFGLFPWAGGYAGNNPVRISASKFME
jgi:hypothetical protein